MKTLRRTLMVAAAAAIVAGLAFWSMTRRPEDVRSQLEQDTQLVAIGVKLQLTAEVESRADAVARVAAGCENTEHCSESLDIAAQNLSARFHDLDGMAWLDSAGQMRWQFTRSGRDAAIKEVLAGASAIPAANATSFKSGVSVARAGNPRYFLVAAPVASSQKTGGMVWAAFNERGFLNTLFRNAARDFEVSVFDGATLIHSRYGSKLHRNWAQQARLQLRDLNWNVSVEPSESRLEQAGFAPNDKEGAL